MDILHDLDTLRDYIALRRKKDGGVKFFIHTKCEAKATETMVLGLSYQMADTLKDGDAHILSLTDTMCAYRIENDIYIIPATAKAVINNNDGKLMFYFDYPVKMERKDLVEF